MKLHWNIILSIIVCLLLGWFYILHPSENDLEKLIKDKKSPEYIGQKMKTTVFSLTGKKQYLADAKLVEYYNNGEYSIFKKPVVHLFDIENKQFENQSWKLSAEQAKLTKDNILHLSGNVIAISLIDNSRLQKIATENAVVNLKTQDITSDTDVKIIGQNFNSSGKKLIGNLHQQIAILKEQVKTRYELNNN